MISKGRHELFFLTNGIVLISQEVGHKPPFYTTRRPLRIHSCTEGGRDGGVPLFILMNGPRTEVGSGTPKLFSITPMENEDGGFGIQDSAKCNTAAFEKLYIPGQLEYFQNNWYRENGSCT